MLLPKWHVGREGIGTGLSDADWSMYPTSYLRLRNQAGRLGFTSREMAAIKRKPFHAEA
jgi:hypothetical protein